MEHSRGVIFHFSLFEVEIFRLVVCQTGRQTYAIAVLITATTSTRWPEYRKKKQIEIYDFRSKVYLSCGFLHGAKMNKNNFYSCALFKDLL